jgi:hypothetical protein
MRLNFDNADGYSELYVWNVDRGYNTGSLTGQFTYQYLYKTSNTCPCETNGLQYGMPAFFIDATPLAATSATTKIPYWIKPQSGNTELKRPDACTKYFSSFDFYIPINGVNQAYYLANQFWVDSNNVPAGMTINDFQQRTFTFTGVKSVPCGTLALKPPTTGCKCAKLLDLVISLDRSGSVQVSQWKDELAFTKNLTAAFEYGPNKCNAGITNWNAAQWNTLDITSGTSDPVVKSAVNSMTCCGTPPASNPTSSCCCCGTPIGGGLYAAGKMMMTSTRTKATKVIAILTDGCQNHIWDPLSNPPAISCGCSSEIACQTNTNCTNDITKWYNWIQKNIPGCKVIAIGVGTSATICPSQLLLAAGNDPTMVFQPQSWSDLITIVQTISATACTTDNVLCPGCCGICTCGICYPATKCFDQDKCNLGAIPQGSQCCGVTPVICTPPPCQNAVCDPVKGCQYSNLTCQKPGQCSEWFCDSTTVICQQRPLSPVPQACTNKTIPQCNNNTDCNDRTNCTTDACISGKCVYTPIICPASTNCSFTSCLPTVGCHTTNKTCNDNNACTTDSCDPLVNGGCVFKNITCVTPKDPCKYSFCDKIDGCITADVACSNLTQLNCTTPACNQTCFLKYICYTPPPTGEENAPPTTIILASTLTTAAIAGIVCGAVILAVGVGGGAAVAVAGGAGGGGVTAVYSNPTYTGDTKQGVNPLNQQG